MYTIGEVSKMMNISVSTLRYYDSVGLLLNVSRNENGNRVFDSKDINSLILIECLKASGMKIKEIKEFIDLCLLGNDSLKDRLEFFKKQEQVIDQEIKKLENSMNMIKFKQWYYSTDIEHNDENYVRNLSIENMPKEIRELYKKTHHIN